MTSRQSSAMRTDRHILIEAPPDRVWAVLRHVEHYQGWWPWLRSFDAEALAAGDHWTCTVQAPLPYRVRFTIELREVVDESSVTALVGGDICGPARIDLVAEGSGTVLGLSADLRAGSTWLRFLERWAHPIARFGHDRILDRALGELAARLTNDDG